jgi:hypothetical protein
MATMVRKIPDQLAARGLAGQDQYVLSDFAYDYAIAGIPFLSATNDQRPYTERMAEFRKQQFDSFAEPGEQSISGNFWWLRSQSSFTGGAGILYQDPDTDNQFNYRFSESLGIDPWNPGDLSLLRQSTAGAATATLPLIVRGYVDPTNVDSYWRVAGQTLTKVTDAGSTAIVMGAFDIRDITSSGARYFVARSNGVWNGLDTAAPTQLYTDALNTTAEIEFVKGRLILAHNNSVYQLVTGGAPAVLPTATFTHQDAAWTWKSITDGPTAIYVAGDSGTTSEIHKFTPTVTGSGVPVLAWAGVTATMPSGEIIRTIYQYVGSFVGIATNKGFRVGEIDGNGDIAYGPLLFEPTGGCEGIVGNDRFMWVGSTNAHDGASGLFRVDLGATIQEQTTRAVRYAYARDIYAETFDEPITSVTMFGASDRKVFAVEGIGAFKEEASTLLESGYLETGRIRFNTEEPKLYKFFSVRTASPLHGEVAVTILPEGGGEINAITYSPTVPSGTGDVGIQTPSGPQNWLALRFTLRRGSDPALGGVLNGWQIKALPGSIRQRTISHTFLLLDEEVDKTGQRIGYEGYTRVRFDDFKAVARAGDVVLFQELQENVVTQVVIDDWQYIQTAPPGPNQNVLGGYLTVVMRTVAESI